MSLHGIAFDGPDVPVQIRLGHLLIRHGELPPELHQDAALLLLAVISQALHHYGTCPSPLIIVAKPMS
jgi:hypothetical protein